MLAFQYTRSSISNNMIHLHSNVQACVVLPRRRKFGQFAAFLGMLVILLALVKPILNAFILLCVAIPAMVLVITEMKG